MTLTPMSQLQLNFKAGFRAFVICAALLAIPAVSLAQIDRSYHYSDINTAFTVNKDTTVDVKEKQTYAFIGEYHVGWRSIPHKGIDAITNISVVDNETGRSLIYSSSRLNKTDPTSWGKYTSYEQNGATNIEWYYDLPKTSDQQNYTWTLNYTLHGALGFYSDHDELYWNLFTNYSVPVDFVEASIHLPAVITKRQDILYRTASSTYMFYKPDSQTSRFVTTNVEPNEAVTIAVGWQKGMIDKSAYWRDAVKIYWPIGVGIILVLTSILFSFLFWLWEEHEYRGRGVIVAEYEPPKNLTPAMAEVVARGRLSKKTWAATVIDLAVRGYLTITEEKKKTFFFFSSINYILASTKKDTSSLRKYEREFFSLLFSAGRTILSLTDIKASRGLISGQIDPAGNLVRFSKGIQDITKDLYANVMEETNAFVNSPVRSWYWWKWFHAVWILAVIGIFYLPSMSQNFTLSKLFLACSIVIAVAIIVYVVKVRPELNRQGHLLKEDWMGFKLFLEVTGKDRMQNLTPDMFEKFLPYAMIFGVEKKWAQKFDTLNLPPPQWYGGTGFAMQSGGSPMGSFSPSSFTSGFSTSFASSFASSGGGGGGAGGGGAGGGGGGGGGGAG